MNYLYVKDGCPGCKKAKEFLMAGNEEYKEVAVDNPILEIGINTLLGKPHILVPLLVRTDGSKAEVFAPAVGPEGSFSFMRIKVALGN